MYNLDPGDKWQQTFIFVLAGNSADGYRKIIPLDKILFVLVGTV